MAAVPFGGKWLPDVAPDDRTVDVAARALASRLDAVRRYLKRVTKSGSVEDVHQLRVWTRRADAALTLYAELLQPKDWKWFRRWLRRLRRAAGLVRNCDVFAPRFAEPKEKWPIHLLADRRRDMKKLRALANRLDNDRRLKRRARKLVHRLATDTRGSMRFDEFARAKLAPMVAGFFAAAPTATADDGVIHQFRIRGKELRYAMELLAGAFPPSFNTDLYPQIGALQERLGKINDLSTAEDQLNDWLAATGKPAAISRLHRHLAETSEELIRARAEFRQWWTPELAATLQLQFAAYLTADWFEASTGS